MKDPNHRAARSQSVNKNSDREIFLGYHAVEAHCYGFLSRKVASYPEVINNVSPSILNISQANDDNSISVIELEAKRSISTRVTGNEEVEFDFSTGWTRCFKIASPEDDCSPED